ncbi:hypothetical protein [Acididesulfobacillus acetoxydans]
MTEEGAQKAKELAKRCLKERGSNLE